LGLIVSRRIAALFVSALAYGGLAAPAHADWLFCHFSDAKEQKLYYSAPFQGSYADVLRNQTIFEANVYMKGATITPEVTCDRAASRAAAQRQIDDLIRQAQANGLAPTQLPAQ
jgi:hypothetical protein